MRIGITGLSGTLGTALCRALIDAGIRPVVGITRDEFKAEQIAAQYGGIGGDVRVMIVAEGVKDQAKLTEVFRGCDVLIHAAALKRISGSVYAAEEMVETNVMGTLSVLKAATAAGVGKVLVISSDKAVQATNLYGGTKFLAECLAVQENAFAYPCGTRISVVRYGNVLGSRGSVVPLWRQQIRGGTLPCVTHEFMTRFVITIAQAVDFILACSFSMQGGEIFVPLLPTARMLDLAWAVIKEHEQSIGCQGQIEPIITSQLRPGGEKLAERLLSEEETSRTVLRKVQGGFHGPIECYAVLPSHRTWSATPYAGDAIPDGMQYRSDDSGGHLTVEQLMGLLKETP